MEYFLIGQKVKGEAVGEPSLTFFAPGFLYPGKLSNNHRAWIKFCNEELLFLAHYKNKVYVIRSPIKKSALEDESEILVPNRKMLLFYYWNLVAPELNI